MTNWNGTVRVRVEGTLDNVVGAPWKLKGRVDAIMSTDYFPAVQGPLEDALAEDLVARLDKLVVAPFRLIKAAAPRFKAQGGGNVVMITICRTRLPMPGGTNHDAAREAANALVRSFSIELVPFGIIVNAIAPNFHYSEAYYSRSRFIDDPAGRAYGGLLVCRSREAGISTDRSGNGCGHQYARLCDADFP